jgi:hypothetical protein
MKVLIDKDGLQAQTHLVDGKRLSTFLSLFGNVPDCTIEFSTEDLSDRKLLANTNLLIIATRNKAFKPKEISAITDYVWQGGGLLLMSNHGDIPGKYDYNYTKNDAHLASQFDVTIENTFFAHPQPKIFFTLEQTDFAKNHPVISGIQGQKAVRSIVSNNCCSLTLSAGTPIISFNNSIIDHRNGLPARNRHFAVALEKTEKVLDGRVVIVADSGFLGTDGTTYPGRGMIECGDNSSFVQNIIFWLLRLLE